MRMENVSLRKGAAQPLAMPASHVSVMSISQASRATFPDLYFRLPFVFFIRSGSKRVVCPVKGEMVGEAGDIFIFDQGSWVTMENRPVAQQAYQADGVCFAPDLIEDAFGSACSAQPAPAGVQLVRGDLAASLEMLAHIHDTTARADLPASIRRHRLLEPLVWLRHYGVHISAHSDEQPLSQVRALIETDLSHNWRIADVARAFAMSEATFRRRLTRTGQGFAKILLHTRLERGLAMLQTSAAPISDIALECGFSTPSHFSDSFKKRFGISPKAIRGVDN